MRSGRITLVVVAALIVIVVAGGGVYLATHHGAKKMAATPTPVVATNSVSIQNYMFSPAEITVKVGTSVTWTNHDSVGHTITGDNVDELSSTIIEHGKTYTHTFNKVGSYTYHCSPHPYMKGTVIVTQ
jgi:amicyanin